MTTPEAIRRLEALAANAWPAATVEVRAGWRLSLDAGITRRANSVIANTIDADADPEALIDEVERRYRARSLPPCFKLCAACAPADLPDRLRARGYREEGASHVLARPVGAPTRPALTLHHRATPDATWLAACWPNAAPRTLAAQRAIVERIVLPRSFVVATLDGAPAGAGLGVCEQRQVCLTAIHTLKEHRRRGVARSILAGLAGWAAERGALFLHLQVEADNHAALGLYAGAGFRHHHDYRYACLR